MLSTNVYVDGFNLYYRCCKGTRFKWLDMSRLLAHAYPQNCIGRIRYFTARVAETLKDPGQPQRQEIYLRALRTIPCLTVHFGRFSAHKRRMPLVESLSDGTAFAQVWYTTEKGSDVNLASYLLRDGFLGEYESAIVVSNDSDLIEPVRLIGKELGLPVGILNPERNPKRAARGLRDVAAYYRIVTRSALENSQFPPVLEDSQGVFHKPDSW